MTDGMRQLTVAGDGATLTAVEAGDPSRPTVVFIHGYPDTKAMWSRVMALLAADFHLVAYDVRGAGESSAPHEAAAYDLERLGDDLLAVIGAVSPEAPVHLVGHDWGGIQGWEFATQARFRNHLASLTTIAGPSLDQVAMTGVSLLRAGKPWRALARARNSWYILVLLLPGGPSLAWRVLLGGRRWRSVLEHRERIPVDGEHPAPTLSRDAQRGANLYRRNIPRRLLRPRTKAIAHVPVQLIIPDNDRFIPPGYYELAEQHAPRLRRHTVSGTHWVPRSEPELIATLIRRFVEEGVRPGPAKR